MLWHREELKEALLWRDEFGERYGYFSTMLGMLPSILAVLREYRSEGAHSSSGSVSVHCTGSLVMAPEAQAYD